MMNLFANKKGQGLSLTVIIVAALALIVLVVLVAIFLGRIGTFGEGVSKAGQADLLELKVSYGTCHPAKAQETVFLNAYAAAEGLDDLTAQQEEKDAAYQDLSSEISRCKSAASDEANCLSFGCAWG